MPYSGILFLDTDISGKICSDVPVLVVQKNNNKQTSEPSAEPLKTSVNPGGTDCPLFLSSSLWGAADAEIKVPSDENTELKGSSFKAWSRSVCCHACYSY